MNALRDFFGFFLGAAITAALGVLLLPTSQCGVDQRPALQLADPNTKTLQTAAANGHGDDKLAALLRSAASEDNTIIMAFTNEAWTAPGSLVDTFLESFRVGVKTRPLLKQLVLVAVDEKGVRAVPPRAPALLLPRHGRRQRELHGGAVVPEQGLRGDGVGAERVHGARRGAGPQCGVHGRGHRMAPEPAAARPRRRRHRRLLRLVPRQGRDPVRPEQAGQHRVPAREAERADAGLLPGLVRGPEAVPEMPRPARVRHGEERAG